MEFKDYYATLGLARTASQADIKRAYRKLARKYHPDVSKEPDAEGRFKELAEAHEALIDSGRRAAYDALALRHAQGQDFEPPSDWAQGFAGSQAADHRGGGRRQAERTEHSASSDTDFSDFFEALFGHVERGQAPPPRASPRAVQGHDQHAQVHIGLLDAYQGVQRVLTLHAPAIDAMGRSVIQARQLEVQIPKGVRNGQRLRLAGQGAPGQGGLPAGDLFLEVVITPHPAFELDGGDISFDLPLSPWEAALGAVVTASTPGGLLQLTVPAGSSTGRKLRLKGRGLPGKQPGDLFAVLRVALPPAKESDQKQAYAAFAQAFANYNPRQPVEA